VSWQRLPSPIEDLLIGVGGTTSPVAVGVRRLILGAR
jgi:hypothetical protein